MDRPLKNELKAATKAALKAGRAISRFYETSYRISEKAPDDPVTEADLAANKIIKSILQNKFPHDGWLSEEDLTNTLRFEKKRVWIIDPLDGTKEFINKNPEFAISIALIEHNVPILGVIYNPITKDLFQALKNQGAWRNGKNIHVKDFVAQEKPHLLVSVSEHKRGEWDQYQNTFQLTPRGGAAFKMANIAQGCADGTFTKSPKNEWDICAGHILIEEAGGIVCDLEGSPITYNKPITSLPGVVYCNCEDVKKSILLSIANTQ
ncbi:MAG: 3'(2'),5'-bisphosphate nucleotidase CysQ [bacterium]|nr:3'(2'),5'-bisphosphate nucleotidase CysQ [bacterium]MBU1916618.1 3'(2'),5'-bisphosphate nucleotidase CysQ [bacterium]